MTLIWLSVVLQQEQTGRQMGKAPYRPLNTAPTALDAVCSRADVSHLPYRLFLPLRIGLFVSSTQGHKEGKIFVDELQKTIQQVLLKCVLFEVSVTCMTVLVLGMKINRRMSVVPEVRLDNLAKS